MKIPESRIFLLPAPTDAEKIAQALPKDLHLSKSKNEPTEAILLDTFDGALQNKDTLLLQTAETLILLDLINGTLQKETANIENGFAENLPEGAMRSGLAPCAPLRAFLPITTLTIYSEELRLLDGELKTRCRLQLLRIVHEKKSVLLVITTPMRGYNASHGLLGSTLESLAAAEKYFLPLLNIKPLTYSAKPLITLDPETPIIESKRNIISTLLNAARQNEPGIIADYDTEFLHDYRVCLRKIRSVLSLFKSVIAEEKNTELKRACSNIMRQTNPLRDSDVYLLARDEYFQLVPPRLHPGLEILFDQIKADRDLAHQKICTLLESNEYRKEITRLADAVKAPGSLPLGDSATEPTGPYACRLILKRYKKVCKIARKITENTPDEIIHDLRIQCKKLRYLIESFRPLFPAKKVKKLLKKLKRMQEHLGLFNDMSVQQIALAEFISGHRMPGRRGILLAEAIGALTSMLYQEQLKERRLIINNLAVFGSPDMRDAFNNLFSQEN